MKARLYIDATQRGVKGLGLGHKRTDLQSAKRNERVLSRRWKTVARKELAAYFAGRLRSFSTPCDLGSLPPFTQAVLRITAHIPYGEVRSYRWVAARLGNPKASRAVGNALARNPIPILIPCHRVVRSNGAVGGYALGLHWKRRLLKLEKCQRTS